MPDNNALIFMGDILKGGSMIAGGITQANAIQQQNQYSQQVFAFNSSMATLKAKEAITTGLIEENQVGVKTREEVGRQKAQIAAGGFLTNTGTSAEVQEQTASVGAHDELMVSLAAQRQALAYETDAYQSKEQGQLANLSATNRTRSTIWSGVTGGLGEVSKGFTNLFPTPPPNFGGPAKNSANLVDWDLAAAGSGSTNGSKL